MALQFEPQRILTWYLNVPVYNFFRKRCPYIPQLFGLALNNWYFQALLLRFFIFYISLSASWDSLTFPRWRRLCWHWLHIRVFGWVASTQVPDKQIKWSREWKSKMSFSRVLHWWEVIWRNSRLREMQSPPSCPRMPNHPSPITYLPVHIYTHTLDFLCAPWAFGSQQLFIKLFFLSHRLPRE